MRPVPLPCGLSLGISRYILDPTLTRVKYPINHSVQNVPFPSLPSKRGVKHKEQA